MPDMQSARRGVADAELSKADWPFGSDNTQIDATAQPLAGDRYECQVVCVHALGPRPLGEMLSEIAKATGRPDIVVDRVEAYSRLDPELIRYLGGDRFPPMPLQVMP